MHVKVTYVPDTASMCRLVRLKPCNGEAITRCGIHFGPESFLRVDK